MSLWLLALYVGIESMRDLVTHHRPEWWWLDPVAGLAVAAVAIKEGRQAWRGETCCAVPGVVAQQGCAFGADCAGAWCAVAPDSH